MALEFRVPRREIEERRRQRELEAERDRDICRRCFQTNHNRRFCVGVPTVACSICFRLNVFTTWCCGRKNREEIAGQRQAFRFAGTPPRPFIDVNVMTMNIPALFDPGSPRSRIDSRLAQELKKFEIFCDPPDNFYTSTGMSVPIGIRGDIFWLDCQVTSLEPTVHLALGMDYFMHNPFEVKFDTVKLHSANLWKTAHHEQIAYVYNTTRGASLRTWLINHGYTLQPDTYRPAFNRYRQYFSRDPARNVGHH